MFRKPIPFLMPFLLLLFVSCVSIQTSPDTLYFEASWSANEAQRVEKDSYLAAYEYYKSAGEKIEQYIANNPSSERTLGLKAETLRIGPHIYKDLREKVIPLAKRKARAESNPIETALLYWRNYA